MPIDRATIKDKIKTKLEEMENEEGDNEANNLDKFVEIFLVVIDDLLQNAVITGTCTGNGGQLLNGKIT